MEEERVHCTSVEQELEALVKRKEELKEQLRSAEDELADVKESHRYNARVIDSHCDKL